MKIIINTPKLTLPAGVANHYLGLRPYFTKDVIYNQYIPISSLKRFKNKIIILLVGTFLKLYDVAKFIALIIINSRPTILLNPSFGRTAMARDALFVNIAKVFSCKVAVFIHGWDKVFLNKVLNKNSYLSKALFRVDAFFVLGTEFIGYLRRLGVNAPIYLTSTKVDDMLIKGVEFKQIDKIETILFLGRITREKGIFITVDAFNLLHRDFPYLKLRVVGAGNALEEAKKYAKDKGLKTIVFAGPLFGEALKAAYLNADLYILPTAHGEGLPTSVLEAMAFGLPVITRPVGGLVDFFENDKMGYLIKSLEPKEFADKIEFLINNIDKANQISKYDMQYARKHFMASKIAPAVEKILHNL